MGENISLTPLGGGSIWEPEPEQETSFGGESLRIKVLKEKVEGLYQKLSERRGETPEAFHFDYFELRDGELYYKGKNIETIADILDKNRLRNLGFDIPRGKITAWQAVMLNKVEEELRPASDIAKAVDIELQEITESTTKSITTLLQKICDINCQAM